MLTNIIQFEVFHSALCYQKEHPDSALYKGSTGKWHVDKGGFVPTSKTAWIKNDTIYYQYQLLNGDVKYTDDEELDFFTEAELETLFEDYSS